jgi:hypothetical protein
MGNANLSDEDKARAAKADENRLRGKGLKGAEEKTAADHAAYEERRNPDTELRVDGEVDTLYDDGLDLEEDADETPAGTRGSSSGIKP